MLKHFSVILGFFLICYYFHIIRISQIVRDFLSVLIDCYDLLAVFIICSYLGLLAVFKMTIYFVFVTCLSSLAVCVDYSSSADVFVIHHIILALYMSS